MRVLHVGNVANNGYLNAKFQRRDGIEADAICDETHILSLPEWEDADLHGAFEPYPDPAELAREGDWRRPPWILEPSDPVARRRVPGQFFLQGLARSYAEPVVRPSIARRVRADYGPLEPLVGPLRPLDLSRGRLALERFSLLWPDLPRLFARYDLVQAYATHPILAYLAGSGVPFVAFEHGTLRELPFEDSWRGRLLALAYREAAKVVITNADVIGSAKRLGLENTVFIPHPVDETKYTPGPSPFRAELGIAEDEGLLVSPSSQTWHLKGNDALLRGFAEHLRGGRPAVLVLTDWGPDVERSRALARELGVAERLRWLAPLPKLRLIEAYRAADLVLDQFVLGTFGAIAPEAMACGCPVVMAFDARVHEWCFPVPPPVVAARGPGEIAAAIGRLLGDDEERERVGTASRRWVEEQHGWQLVTDRHRTVYEEALQ
jgi:glycosyltransferase involved in cell wall biosynthesis